MWLEQLLGFNESKEAIQKNITICAGILNGDNRVYLTLVGGGVFGNDLKWVCSAIERAMKIVNYGTVSGEVLGFVERFNHEKIIM